jgi:hypothetical protein
LPCSPSLLAQCPGLDRCDGRPRPREQPFANFTGPFYHGPEVFLAIFGETLGHAATYLPLAAFAAGISAARELAAPRARLHLLLALASVGMAVFLLDAYLGPWLRHAGLHAFGRAAGGDIPWGDQWTALPPQRSIGRCRREKGGSLRSTIWAWASGITCR